MYKIPVSKPSFDKNEWENLKECIESTWISSTGRFITQFETDFAKFCGTKYGISTSNGTTALHLALLALGVGSGDEVIVPALTFVATANTVLFTSAKPVLADIDELSWTINPSEVEKKINKKTKAIIVVHLYGYPADMESLIRIARKHNLLIIEDAAEAHGATIKIRNSKFEIRNFKVGSLGDIGCFSFYGNKIITTGEGGMITLNSKKIADKIRILKNHGEGNKKYYHPVVGFNYRMTNLQATVGCAQLRKIDKFLTKRKKIDQLYRKYLSGIPGIILPPDDTHNRKAVCWLFSVLVTEKFGITRNNLISALGKSGIETRPFFVPLYKLPMYKDNNNYPISEKISSQGINLPTFVDLTEDNIKFIAKEIEKAQLTK